MVPNSSLRETRSLSVRLISEMLHPKKHKGFFTNGAAPEELLWQYSRARNWNAVLDRFHEVEDPAVKEEAARHLIRWLLLDAARDAITAGLAEFRLDQLSAILGEVDQESDAFVQMEGAVKSALERRSVRAGAANASDAEN